MEIATVKHKGLRRYIESGDARNILAGQGTRLRHVLSAIRAAKNLKALSTFPGLRLHRLKGKRKDEWSVTVTGNWRLTFSEDDDHIFDLDMEDYH